MVDSRVALNVIFNMTAQTETFVKTHRNKFYPRQTHVTVVRTEARKLDLDLTARWIKTIGATEIVKVVRVTVIQNDVQFPAKTPFEDVGFEVTFKSGAVGYVNAHREHQELDALLVGTKGYLHGLAVWRKHGNIVGTPCAWFSAQKGPRARLNPNTAPRCCALELYYRAAGKPWGDK